MALESPTSPILSLAFNQNLMDINVPKGNSLDHTSETYYYNFLEILQLNMQVATLCIIQIYNVLNNSFNQW